MSGWRTRPHISDPALIWPPAPSNPISCAGIIQSTTPTCSLRVWPLPLSHKPPFSSHLVRVRCHQLATPAVPGHPCVAVCTLHTHVTAGWTGCAGACATFTISRTNYYFCVTSQLRLWCKRSRLYCRIRLKDLWLTGLPVWCISLARVVDFFPLWQSCSSWN